MSCGIVSIMSSEISHNDQFNDSRIGCHYRELILIMLKRAKRASGQKCGKAGRSSKIITKIMAEAKVYRLALRKASAVWKTKALLQGRYKIYIYNF